VDKIRGQAHTGQEAGRSVGLDKGPEGTELDTEQVGSAVLDTEQEGRAVVLDRTALDTGSPDSEPCRGASVYTVEQQVPGDVC